MRFYWKKIAFFCLWFLCGAGLYAEPFSSEYLYPFETRDLEGRWEFSAAAFWRSNRYADPDGADLSSYARGINLRALYFVNVWLGIGAEWESSHTRTDGQVLAYLKEERLALLVKAVLSPDVAPRAYIFAGPGMGIARSRDIVSGRNSTSYPFFQAGLGSECDISEHVSVGMEGGAAYSEAPDLNRFMRRREDWEVFLRVRLIYRL